MKIFVTNFSGTMKPIKLKLGTHVDNGWMYCVYRSQAAAAYSSLYFFIFLSPQFSNIKFCVILLSGTMMFTKLNRSTHVNNVWMYRIYLLLIRTLYLHLSFSPILNH